MTAIPEGVTRVTVGGLTVGGAWGDPPPPDSATTDQPDKTGPASGQEVSN